MALADFRYVMRFRVPFHDIDMMQHVNHAAYIVWAETVRCSYFTDVIGGSLTGSKALILARLEFDYERPLDYGEQVAIGCRTARLGRKSLDLAYEIWSESCGQRAARGISAMVAYDYERKASQLIPDEWRKTVMAYETLKPVTNDTPSS
jgi:acyl-CoA thioester hydrolase